MEVYKIDSTNVSSAITQLKAGGKYFVIATDIIFPKGNFVIGENSVLDFKGGSFITQTQTTLSLNSNLIVAGAYPIFNGQFKLNDLTNSEVRAEWFRSTEDESDDVYINRAIENANYAPVVLESRIYILKDSIKFISGVSTRQTLICPGTLRINPDNPADEKAAIEINCQTITLKINNITGTNVNGQNYGIGINFLSYNEYSDIRVNKMTNLSKGFCVCPNIKDPIVSPDVNHGGIQYARINFGTINADYCFYIDVYSHTEFVDTATGEQIEALPTDKEQLQSLKLKALNWFNQNQISGESMRGKYGIYTVSPTEVLPNGEYINPENVSDSINGLKFENISFEYITELPIRICFMTRCTFQNLHMYNNLPGKNDYEKDDYAPWIDIAYVYQITMTINSFVLPNHIKAGKRCQNSYIYGTVLDNPGSYSSHFDTLGIDVLYGLNQSNELEQVSQMFVTSSVTPYNMAKNVIVNDNQTLFVKDILPNLNADATSSEAIQLPVLSSALNLSIGQNKTCIIDLSGLNFFVPCIYTVNATIASGAKLQFRTSDYTVIDGGTYISGGVTIKDFNSSGIYQIQWLGNWSLQIKKL